MYAYNVQASHFPVSPSQECWEACYMIDLLFTPPIKKQIAQFVAWKSGRYPLKALTYERVLLDFAKFTKMRSVQDIELSPKCVDEYRRSLNANYQKAQFDLAINGFLRYWYKMHVMSREFEDMFGHGTMFTTTNVKMHTEQVKRVQDMMNIELLSLRQIQAIMEREDKRRYHLKQIQRWSKYDLPKLSPRDH